MTAFRSARRTSASQRACGTARSCPSGTAAESVAARGAPGPVGVARCRHVRRPGPRAGERPPGLMRGAQPRRLVRLAALTVVRIEGAGQRPAEAEECAVVGSGDSVTRTADVTLTDLSGDAERSDDRGDRRRRAVDVRGHDRDRGPRGQHAAADGYPDELGPLAGNGDRGGSPSAGSEANAQERSAGRCWDGRGERVQPACGPCRRSSPRPVPPPPERAAVRAASLCVHRP